VEEQEAGRAARQHQADPPDEVVEVHAAVAHHAARPPLEARAAAEPSTHPDKAEGDEEADQHEEQPLPVVRHELVVPEVAEDRSDHAERA
jgi:hypothetical protein